VVVYNPRGYAQDVWNHMADTPRCGVNIGMGGGKTSLTLFHLSMQQILTGSTPRTLVIGPKRVAKNVWAAETKLWQGLGHLRTSVIIGTPEQRHAALRVDADIYTVNYENLEWLVKTLDGAWPFECVVCDESTKLSGFRGGWAKHPKTGTVFYRRGGTVRAAELGSVAHKSKQWINLSGSMTAGGVQNMWPCTWFLDRGKALGGTYTAFTDRWFKTRIGTSREAAVFEPWPGATEEIIERCKHLYITIDTYKYFQIGAPNFVHVPVYLDSKLKAQYRILRDECVLALKEDAVITAVNAGAKINKCLQFCSGALIDSATEQVHDIHSLKIEALESIVEESGGAPIIVTYWYKHDIKKIKARFPQAVLFDDNKETEDKWNRGEIPMLLLHPMSAGHGVSLQHGGHNMVIYTPFFSLDLFLQVIERIGPMRQMQSGYKRLVNVYLIEAENTWDGRVWSMLESKRTAHEMITEALTDEKFYA
jgi:hypothetical protein